MEIKEKDVRDNRLLKFLAERYPTKESIYEKLIYLQAQLALPKTVEHFMSDLHGEYDSFFHIINNCSGVIREKVDFAFGVSLTDEEKAEFCTLIYYPNEKLEQLKEEKRTTPDWYRKTLSQLLELSKLMSYKYPASKIRTFIPKSYESVIVELMNTRPDVDNAQFAYHKQILNTIVQIDSGADFIRAFTVLIKRLAVDKLHFVGDFFDRGSRPDAILNLLMQQESVDIQWGNHDVLWMGAAMGSLACIASVVRNSLHYDNTEVLERGYGISLRPLTTFAAHIYSDEDSLRAAEKAILIMLFKLEGQVIRRNPDFQMEGRLFLDKIDWNDYHLTLKDGSRYPLNTNFFPTINREGDPYELSEEEQAVMNDLKTSFTESAMLQRHIAYLYHKGSVYTSSNDNLLFHSSIPMNEDGSFRELTFDGKTYSGRTYFDYADQRARQAYLNKDDEGLDFMYFLWCGRISPIAGREFHTFERAFLADESTWKEPSDPYFHLLDDPDVCEKILEEFNLSPKWGHIINGHVPVQVKKGESPIKAGGKALVIDGGFSLAYRKKTGISGYTLVANSRGLRLLQHQHIANVKTALKENKDIESVSETVELVNYRTTLGDTDDGKEIQDEITDLYNLLLAYQNGLLRGK